MNFTKQISKQLVIRNNKVQNLFFSTLVEYCTLIYKSPFLFLSVSKRNKNPWNSKERTPLP